MRTLGNTYDIYGTCMIEQPNQKRDDFAARTQKILQIRCTTPTQGLLFRLAEPKGKDIPLGLTILAPKEILREVTEVCSLQANDDKSPSYNTALVFPLRHRSLAFRSRQTVVRARQSKTSKMVFHNRLA